MMTLFQVVQGAAGRDCGGSDDPARNGRGTGHAGAQRPAVRLVDDDEGAGGPVLAVGVDRQRRRPAPAGPGRCRSAPRELVGTQHGHRAGLEVQVERAVDGLDDRLGDRRAVLDQHPGADGQLPLGQPAHGGRQLADRRRRGVGGGQDVTAGHVDVWCPAGSPPTARRRRPPAVRPGCRWPRPRRATPRGSTTISSPTRTRPDSILPGVPAVVAVDLRGPGGPGRRRGGLRPDARAAPGSGAPSRRPAGVSSTFSR